MKINSKHYTALFVDEDDNNKIKIIDQTLLPFKFELIELNTVQEVIEAIVNMRLRGAPLIGIAGAFGVYLSLKQIKDGSLNENDFETIINDLSNCRPTAVNLSSGVKSVILTIYNCNTLEERVETSFNAAKKILELEIESCSRIGSTGLEIIKEIYKNKKSQVNILTHCNAGWLATGDWGTATAPIYKAHLEGIPLHVYVSETRPRNQGSKLTAYELYNEGINHTIIPDSSSAFFMGKGDIDMVILGADRVSLSGQLINKIGTYDKAICAYVHNIPFYAAVPLSTFDRNTDYFSDDSIIEYRSEDELKICGGIDNEGKYKEIIGCNPNSKALNPAFDITPAKYISGFITEDALVAAERNAIEMYLSHQFPQKI